MIEIEKIYIRCVAVFKHGTSRLIKLLGLNETMRVYLTLLLFLCSSSAYSNDVFGNYSTVTESEFVLKLTVDKNFKLQLTIEILSQEEGDDSSINVISGSWQVSANKLFVNFDNDEKITYEIQDCLSYTEFGLQGCSYGLKPVQGTYKNDTLIMQYGMWRDEDLKKLWSK
jgi:hypothetical protein